MYVLVGFKGVALFSFPISPAYTDTISLLTLATQGWNF